MLRVNYLFYQLWKSDPKSAMDMGANGFPWWWNWLERQLPSGNANKSPFAVKLTPPRAISEHKPSPTPLNNNVTFRRILSDYDNNEASVTPMSTKSAIPTRGKKMHTPSRTPPMNNSSSLKKYSRAARASGSNYPFDLPLKDDDSLTSCPPFSVPHYMSQTASASAKAKARASSNPKERNPEKQANDTKKRFSFPLTPNIWSSKWSKGSGKDSTSRQQVDKHESMADHVSVDSTVSMPAVVGGKRPFNRFV